MNIYYTKLLLKKVKGIKLGYSFLDSFLENIKNIEKNSALEIDPNSLCDLSIYDYRNDCYIKLKVDPEKFQLNFSAFYRGFLEKEYFSQFPWFRELSEVIKSFPQNEIVSENLLSILLICLVKVSKEEDSIKYSCFNFKNYFLEIFLNLGFSENTSVSIFQKLFDFLEKKGLITINNNYGFFKISDYFFHAVLHLSCLSVPSFFEEKSISLAKQSIKLEKIISTVESFSEKIDSDIYLKKMKQAIQYKFWVFYTAADDYEILDIDFDLLKQMQYSSVEVENMVFYTLYSMYFYKIFLTEYCFFSLVMSPFDSFYNSKDHKNILFIDNMQNLVC